MGVEKLVENRHIIPRSSMVAFNSFKRLPATGPEFTNTSYNKRSSSRLVDPYDFSYFFESHKSLRRAFKCYFINTFFASNPHPNNS